MKHNATRFIFVHLNSIRWRQPERRTGQDLSPPHLRSPHCPQSHPRACPTSQRCHQPRTSPPSPDYIVGATASKCIEESRLTSVEMFGCQGREFDSEAASPPLKVSSPGTPPKQGCRATGAQAALGQQQRWLCSALISSLLCCPCNPKTSLFFFTLPRLFHLKCQQKKKWGQCYCNTMLRACTAHHEGTQGLRWCWDSDGGPGSEHGA